MTKKSILFRVDGGRQVGLGHVMRCLALANELRKRNIQSIFFTRSASELIPIFAQHELRVYSLGENAGEETVCKVLQKHAHQMPAHGLVIDIADDFKSNEIKAYADLDIPLAVLDDHGSAEKYCDLLINAIAHPDQQKSENVLASNVFNGSEYIILDPLYSKFKARTERETVERILIAMGGADPFNITCKTLRALSRSALKQEIHVLLGPVYKYRNEVETIRKDSKKEIIVHQNLPVAQMPGLIDSFDLAVMSFGISVYAAAYLGVPTVLIAHHDAGFQAASTFAALYKCGIFLGRHDQVNGEEISVEIDRLIADTKLREDMIVNGREAVDAKGLQRVSGLIESLINNQG